MSIVKLIYQTLREDPIRSATEYGDESNANIVDKRPINKCTINNIYPWKKGNLRLTS